MSGTVPLKPIAELIERSLSIRHVYGEPMTHGDTTVIPVAEVMFAFGAGGAPRTRRRMPRRRPTRKDAPRRRAPAMEARCG